MNNDFENYNENNEAFAEKVHSFDAEHSTFDFVEKEEVGEDEQSREHQDVEKALPLNSATPEFKIERRGARKARRRWISVVALTLVGGLILGTAFGLANSLTTKYVMSNIKIGTTKVSLKKTETKNVNKKGESAELPKSDITAIAEGCMPSIVAITNRGVSDVMTFFGTYTQESTSSGSGIIIGQNDTELLIVTNYHVIANSKELSVIFSPVESELELGEDSEIDRSAIPTAVVKGYNSDKDLAVISVELADIPHEILDEIKIATVGDSTQLRPGDQVVAIGNALGYGQSVTTGIISAVNRKITMESADGSTTVTNSFIQTDAAINPGNSGGALLNMAGELIGINSVKISSSGIEGMGYAIPLTDVSNIIDELMVKKTRNVVDEDKQGFLGITGQDVTSAHTQAFGIPSGVFIRSVTKDLAADKAGIKKGYVITEFDGYTISSISQLQERLTYYKSGETVTVTVMIPNEDAEYHEKKIDVKLSNRSKNIDKTE